MLTLCVLELTRRYCYSQIYFLSMIGNFSMAESHKPDVPFIEKAMRDWSVRRGKKMNKSVLAVESGVATATITKIWKEDSLISEGVFEDIGLALDREPKSLWIHPAPSFPLRKRIQFAYELIVQYINDGRISLPNPYSDDLRRKILNGEIPEVRSWSISINEWEDVFFHLQRRGHLYARFRGGLGIASPTTEQFEEIICVRENYELFLVDLFSKKASDEQQRILDEMEADATVLGIVDGDPMRFADAETKVHLGWCADNHAVRDAFALLLRKSKQIADQLMMLPSEKSRDYRVILTDMPGDLEDIIAAARKDPKNAGEIKKQVRLHMDRTRALVDEIRSKC